MAIQSNDPSRRPRPWLRAVRTIAALALLAALLLGSFAWRVVYHPRVDEMPAEPVDALVVLGPLDPWRVEMAEELMRQGKARNLVLSTPNMPWDALYCEEPHDWPSYCFPPDPSTTRGEAMGTKELAAEHGWKSFAVLTIDFHVPRSRWTFERCLRQPVVVVGRHQSEWDRQRPLQVAYQLAGYVKETAKGRCP